MDVDMYHTLIKRIPKYVSIGFMLNNLNWKRSRKKLEEEKRRTWRRKVRGEKERGERRTGVVKLVVNSGRETGWNDMMFDGLLVTRFGVVPIHHLLLFSLSLFLNLPFLTSSFKSSSSLFLFSWFIIKWTRFMIHWSHEREEREERMEREREEWMESNHWLSPIFWIQGCSSFENGTHDEPITWFIPSSLSLYPFLNIRLPPSH